MLKRHLYDFNHECHFYVCVKNITTILHLRSQGLYEYIAEVKGSSNEIKVSCDYLTIPRIRVHSKMYLRLVSASSEHFHTDVTVLNVYTKYVVCFMFAYTMYLNIQ